MVQDVLTDDTIAAISTPVGEGGIGIVRLSGPSSLAIADAVFVPVHGKKPSSARTHTVHYGHIVASPLERVSKPGKRRSAAPVIDEVILTVMRGPRSYTKEDIVEINCHGGLRAVKEVLDLVVKKGARAAQPGEFTKRAFLNGRIDLSQAEAVLDVIRSKTQRSLQLALGQLEGGLSKSVEEVIDRIVGLTSQIEASIDFSEEDIEPLTRKALLKEVDGVIDVLGGLAKSYDEGIILRQGVLAILCGKPNVGKSSLMNLLLKRDRVIVSAIPGTTRDAVEEMISIRGIPIRLVDTAGIGKAKDRLEHEGVIRSKKYLDLADIAIVVLDYSTRLSAEDLAIIKMAEGKRKIFVVNKSDLKKKIDLNRVSHILKGEKIVTVSVEKRKKIEILEDAIAGLIWQGGVENCETTVVSNARHKALIDGALESMVSAKDLMKAGGREELATIDLRDASKNLGLIVGRAISEDVLDRIFEQFCVGK